MVQVGVRSSLRPGRRSDGGAPREGRLASGQRQTKADLGWARRAPTSPDVPGAIGPAGRGIVIRVIPTAMGASSSRGDEWRR